MPTLTLPPRRGGRPASTRGMPHALRQFTHLHLEPAPGTQHLGPPSADAQAVLSGGWGEWAVGTDGSTEGRRE